MFIIDELQKHAKWKKLDTKDYLLYDSIYTKCLENANIRRQQIRGCLGLRIWMNYEGKTLCGVGNVLILDYGDGFITVNLLKIS